MRPERKAIYALGQGHISMDSTLKLILTAAVAIALQPLSSAAFSLKGTVWEEESNRACKVDPKLLYAIALVESKNYDGPLVKPNPYALNIDNKAYHPSTKAKAADQLNKALTKTKTIAVGAMQVSMRWNGHRVSNAADLLDLNTNVRVGTQIFCEFIKEGKGDLALALGRYHTPNPDLEQVARDYGVNVLRVWRRLIVLEQEG